VDVAVEEAAAELDAAARLDHLVAERATLAALADLGAGYGHWVSLVTCQVGFARFWRRNRRGRQGRRPEGVAEPRRAVEDAAGRGEGKPERANAAWHVTGRWDRGTKRSRAFKRRLKRRGLRRPAAARSRNGDWAIAGPCTSRRNGASSG